MLTAAHDPAALQPSAKIQSGTFAGRRGEALVARLERPGTVGELLATANALAVRGTFYAEVDTTADARRAGVVGAWVTSCVDHLQREIAEEECFVSLEWSADRAVYRTRDTSTGVPYGDHRDFYTWTMIRVGRAWLVLCSWDGAPEFYAKQDAALARMHGVTA